ncbi:MAG TPA: amino acid adenylation domain-containing protein [Geminicoccaceae bacterium]|nr:amino acid adenylation domain-containing protein [Geminicoccaceae bacterium]
MTVLLHHLLTRSAERHPDRTAIVDGGERVTYGDLERHTNRLARLLLRTGLQPGDRVGVLLPKSIAAIAAFLATLKARGIYVPLDPAGPALRIGRILERAGCRHLVTGRALRPLLEPLAPLLARTADGGVVWTDGPMADTLPGVRHLDLAEAEALPSTPPDGSGDGEAAAHLLFTSGSTGEPKGVLIPHRSVAAFVAWANGQFERGPGDRASCHSPLHFDLSTYDIYGSLAAGGELHLCPPQLNMFPQQLCRFIRERRLTHWFSAPSVLAYVARFDAVAAGDFPELRHLLWCGEVFPVPALRYWMERLPHARFTNLYGPTETTIASTWHRVEGVPAEGAPPVPIGVPCPGERVLVLDEGDREAATGAIGELCIAGQGVTLGYWQDPERSARAFPPAADGHGRMYRTGDLGRRDADGVLHFVGRVDSQIKSRGHRIELGEIEAALHAIPGIAQAAVVAVPAGDFAGTDIACAYAPRPDAELEPAALRRALAERLPPYMLPSRWRRMETLPTNANGKIDRPVLKAGFEAEAPGAAPAARPA